MKRLIAAALLGLPAGLLLWLPGGQAAAADLPPAIARSGTLHVAIVPNYPPLDFKDPATGQLTGFDVDLGEAIAGKLGVRIAWQETSFDQMIPAIATGRVDAILSGMSDLATRHDAASFVDYMKTGPQFFVQTSHAAEFPDMKALCGKSVGASRRTNFPKDIAAWSDANCAADKPVKFVGTEGSADARTQLKEGRIDAAVQGSETLPYIMGQEPGSYVALGGPIAVQYTGMAIGVKETGLQQAVAGALDALIADGTYRRLLDKWQLSGAALGKATIDAGQ